MKSFRGAVAHSSLLRRLPVIGIVPAFDEARTLPFAPKSMYIRRSYSEIVSRVHGIPLVLNPDMPMSYVARHCDGIIISGGHDIDPKYYGQNLEQAARGIREPHERFEWELQLMAMADRKRLPVLGICYGMQLLNVYYGGTLCQDLDLHRPENIGHNLTIHTIEFTRDFLGLKKGESYKINSRHHQAIDTLGAGVEVYAVAADKTIEAIAKGNRYGVQWHAENDESGQYIYGAFVGQCRRYRQLKLLRASSRQVIKLDNLFRGISSFKNDNKNKV